MAKAKSPDFKFNPMREAQILEQEKLDKKALKEMLQRGKPFNNASNARAYSKMELAVHVVTDAMRHFNTVHLRNARQEILFAIELLKEEDVALGGTDSTEAVEESTSMEHM